MQLAAKSVNVRRIARLQTTSVLRQHFIITAKLTKVEKLKVQECLSECSIKAAINASLDPSISIPFSSSFCRRSRILILLKLVSTTVSSSSSSSLSSSISSSIFSFTHSSYLLLSNNTRYESDSSLHSVTEVTKRQHLKTKAKDTLEE